MGPRGHSVGEVAALAAISVRTLHYYDAIGLLIPSERSGGGYRLYSEGDLATLQQILFFKELGFGLQAIGRIVNDLAFDRREALVLQRRMLEDRSLQVKKLIGAVDRAIEGIEKGIVVDEKDMFEVFGDFDPSKYEEEARGRWGGTKGYAEWAKRTAKYGKAEWQAIKVESDRLNKGLVDLLDSGVSPDDPRAMDLVEEHRQMISRRFYPCSVEMHVGLGEMYVADSRFAGNYDGLRPGLARYVCSAIKANATRNGV